MKKLKEEYFMGVLVFDINYRFDYKQIKLWQYKKEHFQLSVG